MSQPTVLCRLSEKSVLRLFTKKNATAITLTPTYIGGALRVDGSLWISGRAKEFTLTADTTVITLIRDNVADMTDSAYTITIKKFRGAQVEISEDKKSFTVYPVDLVPGQKVILALYDGNRFVETQTAIYQGGKMFFTTDKAYTEVKVMVWDSVSSLVPVS